MPGARTGLEILITPNPTIIANEYFAAAARGNDLRLPMEEITNLWSSEIDMNFAVGGRPEHWAPLAESTHDRHHRSGEPLVASGFLMGSAGDAGNWVIEGGNPSVAQMQDPTGYGLFHLEGDEDLPIRDWAYVSDDALDKAGMVLLDFVAHL